MDRKRQKQKELHRNGQKQTETDRNRHKRKKRTETESTKQKRREMDNSRQKQTETDINCQKQPSLGKCRGTEEDLYKIMQWHTITTYRLNQSRGRFSENWKVKNATETKGADIMAILDQKQC